jgi:hypothetical protein
MLKCQGRWQMVITNEELVVVGAPCVPLARRRRLRPPLSSWVSASFWLVFWLVLAAYVRLFRRMSPAV